MTKFVREVSNLSPQICQILCPVLTNKHCHTWAMVVDWGAKIAISREIALEWHMKDVCSQRERMKKQWVKSLLWLLISDATFRSLHAKYLVFYLWIHTSVAIQVCVSLSFTILTTLQQSVVAKGGREPGGFSLRKSWEHFIWGGKRVRG